MQTKQPHICYHYVYECECNYLACEAPLPPSLPPALSYDYVFLPVLSEREVCCCAD